MNVIFYCLAGTLFWGLEQRSDIHVKAQISKCGGHHFGAPVVAVLTEF